MFFSKKILFFREKGRKRERERNINVIAPHTRPVGQAKLTFLTKAKTTKKIVLRLTVLSPTAALRECWLLRDTSILNWDEIKKKGR